MTRRLGILLVPVTAWVTAAVLAFKVSTIVQMAWADDTPSRSVVAAIPASVAVKTSDRSAPLGPAHPDARASPVTVSIASQPPAPPPIPPDWKLLQDLRTRKEDLDRRSAALDARATALDAAQHALEVRLHELGQKQAELLSLQSTRKAQEQSGMEGLVKLYEDMRPTEAAAIFDALDLHVLLPILDMMNERKAAAIMGAMEPERARFATQALARYRTDKPSAGASAFPNAG